MNYDYNFWIGVIGSIATIVFGVLSIYLVKAKKYPGNLTFIEEQTIGLFDSLVKNFPQISITYEKRNIDQQILLLKGAIINTGSVDIKDSMIDEKLRLKLPEGFKWLNAKIIDASNGSKADLEVENNIILFNLGLFRRNEFIRFEALADIPQRENNSSSTKKIFQEELKIEHRISDTNKVERRTSELELPKLMNRIGIFKLVYFSMILAFAIFMIFSTKKFDNDFAEFQYQFRFDTSVQVVTASPHLNKSIDLFTVTGKKISTVPLSEFKKRTTDIQINEWKTEGWFTTFFAKHISWILFISIILMLLLSSSFIISPILEYRKIKKLRQALNLDNNEKAAGNKSIAASGA